MICSPAGAHRWSLFILALLASVGLVASARGQTAGIPATVKTASEIGANRAALEQSITTQVQAMLAPNAPADVQTKARQVLENEAKVNGQPTASPAYLDAYAQILSTQLIAQLKALPTPPSPRAKLNAAIAVANVAQLADNVQLKDAAMVFIQDKNEAVVLWGIKAAKWIIPAQLRAFGQKDESLIKLIIPAVQAHSTGIVAGAIVSEAYDALTLNVSDPTLFAKVKADALPTMIQYVLKLLQTRVVMYQKGVPPAPRADAVGTRFLADPKVWPLLNAATKVEAMQSFTDLIGLASKQAQAANPGDRKELAITIQRASAAVSIIVPTNIADEIVGAARLQDQATAAQIATAADSVLVAVRGNKGFEALKDPPAVVGNAPAPPPATAPTTQSVAIPGANTGLPPAVPGGATTKPGVAPKTPAPAVPKTPTPAPTPAKPPVQHAPAKPAAAAH
jgi:hypothetical protein